MHAVVRTRRRGWNVSSTCRRPTGSAATCRRRRSSYSSVEEAFAAKGARRDADGWLLVHEGEILHGEAEVFVPDFAFRHDDGRRRSWRSSASGRRSTCKRSLETLRTFRRHHNSCWGRPDRRRKAVAQDEIVSALPGEVIPSRRPAAGRRAGETKRPISDIIRRLHGFSQILKPRVPCPRFAVGMWRTQGKRHMPTASVGMAPFQSLSAKKTTLCF